MSSRRMDSSDKSMDSYNLAAWRDAMSLATWLHEDFELRAVRQQFDALSQGDRVDFEDRHAHLIAEFIGKTEGQRPAYLRRIGKQTDDVTLGVFVVFGVLALLRVRDVLDLRDRYRDALAPGRGNRMTASALYEFWNAMQGTSAIEWPWEVFEAAGVNGLGGAEA